MNAVSLMDQSSEVALQHACDLERLMRDIGDSTDPLVRECRDRLHELVGDVASVRNAAVLLNRCQTSPLASYTHEVSALARPSTHDAGAAFMTAP